MPTSARSAEPHRRLGALVLDAAAAGRVDAADSVETCTVQVINSAPASAVRSTGVVADCHRLFSLTW